MSLIIGLGYKARSGKDTVADYIVKHHPKFNKTAFADNLKKACREIFGLTDEQLWGIDKGKMDSFWGVTPREILQRVGTECLRDHFHQEVWVKSLEREVKGKYLLNHVITDVRFSNEGDVVKRWGGITVLVDRPSTGELTKEAEKHASETSMDGYLWDYVIENKGTLEDLFKATDDMLRYVRARTRT